MGFAGLVMVSNPAAAGPAVNQFEVEEVNVEQGEVEIQISSDWSLGRPRRGIIIEDPADPDSDVIFDDNSITKQRHSVEVGLGLSNWLQLSAGFEFEEERVDDPLTIDEANSFERLQFTEIQAGAKVVLVPIKGNGLGLAAYAELNHPKSAEASQLFFGPIIQAVNGPFSATANLALVKFIGGDRETEVDDNGLPFSLPRDDKLDFAYFTQVKYQATPALGLALEAYGAIDRLGSTGHEPDDAALFGAHDQHFIGPVAYYRIKTATGSAAKAGADDDDKSGDDDDGGTTVGAGVLFGLNDNTPDTTLKLSVETGF